MADPVQTPWPSREGYICRGRNGVVIIKSVETQKRMYKEGRNTPEGEYCEKNGRSSPNTVAF
jgi:hypothetical protein